MAKEIKKETKEDIIYGLVYLEGIFIGKDAAELAKFTRELRMKVKSL